MKYEDTLTPKFEQMVKRSTDLHETLAQSDPSLELGMVYCGKCRRAMKVDSAECLRKGWPKCCGGTMSLARAP